MTLLLQAAFAAEVSGPWMGGDYVDFAAEGSEVHAVWLKGTDLYYSHLPGAPVRIASAVESGDGGQIRPEVVVASGRATVLYTTAAGLYRVSGSDAWAPHLVSPEGARGPFLAAMAARGQEIHVVGLAHAGAATQVFVDGKVVFTGGADGVCMCCKPAILAEAQGWRVDFRDAEGARREVRSLTSADGLAWVDAGPATAGGWSPGGCPSDGPDRSTSALLVSDGRTGRRIVYSVDHTGERALPSADAAAQMLQPRSVPDGSLLAWVEAVPGENRLVVRDGPAAPAVVTRTPGRLEPGNPIVVGSEVWLPWQGAGAHVERWESQAPPGW